MAQKIMLSLAVFFCWTFVLKAEEYKLSSPDKKLEVKLRVEGRTEFEVWYDKVKLVEPSVIGMNLSDGRNVGGDPVTSVKKDRVNRKIDVVAGKNKTLKEAYNEIVLSYGTFVMAPMVHWPEVMVSYESTEKVLFKIHQVT